MWALGLAGESGEVAEKIKKLYRDHGGVPGLGSVNMIKKELGDVLWYITALADNLGITLQDVAVANLSKLSDRQQRGVIQGEGDER
jgi:NTP pyrophosphatase (non-canonical NTP hydrolase)